MLLRTRLFPSDDGDSTFVVLYIDTLLWCNVRPLRSRSRHSRSVAGTAVAGDIEVRNCNTEETPRDCMEVTKSSTLAAISRTTNDGASRLKGDVRFWLLPIIYCLAFYGGFDLCTPWYSCWESLGDCTDKMQISYPVQGSTESTREEGNNKV